MRETPRASDSARKKAWKPKVRTGCITCKNRRLKCDETKPECRRCASTGRRCEGYRTTPGEIGSSWENHPWSFSWTPRVSVQKPAKDTLTTPSGTTLWPQPRFFVFDTNDEEESFDFFSSYSVSEFTTLFPLDSEFWCSSVLAVAMVQPAIRYAVSALGSLHRHYVDGHAPLLPEDAINHKLGRFGLSQYTKALKAFTELAVSESVLDQLFAAITCVLIIHISSLQGFQTTSFRHLSNALKLYQDMELTTKSTHGSPYDTQIKALRSILMSLQCQAHSLNCNQVYINHFKFSDTSETLRASQSMPISFATLSDARDYYMLLINDLQWLVPDQDALSRIGPAEDNLQLLFNKLLSAEDALHRLRTQSIELQAEHTISCLILQVNFCVMDLYLRAFEILGDNGEMAWDIFEAHFAKIVSLSRQILSRTNGQSPEHQPGCSPEQLNTSSPPTIPGKPVFITVQGILGPLFTTAIHCRVPHIRREAIRLLTSQPRREGLWDSLSTGLVAREVMALEETLYHDKLLQQRIDLPPTPQGPYGGAVIPQDCRVIDVEVTYANPRTMNLRLKTEKQWHQMGKKSIFSG